MAATEAEKGALYKQKIREASSVADIDALKLQLIADKNAGYQVAAEMLKQLQLQEEEARQRQEAQSRARENQQLTLTPDQKKSADLMQGVLLGDMEGISRLLDDPNYKPNTLFAQDIKLTGSDGKEHTVETKGKAFLHVLPALMEHSKLSTEDMRTVVTRMVEEKGADINLASAEGKTALDYAVSTRIDPNFPYNKEKLFAVVDAFLSHDARVTDTTVDLIMQYQYAELGARILSQSRPTQLENDLGQKLAGWLKESGLAVEQERPFLRRKTDIDRIDLSAITETLTGSGMRGGFDVRDARRDVSQTAAQAAPKVMQK